MPGLRWIWIMIVAGFLGALGWKLFEYTAKKAGIV